MENDIHVLALRAAESDEARRQMIEHHYSSQVASEEAYPRDRSALLRFLGRGQGGLFAIFGGQGNNRYYFEELRAIYSTYKPLVRDLVESASITLRALSEDTRVSDQYARGLDVMEWLQNPDSTPPADYLINAPVSFPVIGLLQLAQVKAFCMGLDYSPANLPTLLKGLAGHSQGVVVAAAVSAAEDWPAFHDAAIKAIRILFWIGARCQQYFIGSVLSDDRIDELEKTGYGKPSPMISISGMPLKELERCVTKLNHFLASEDQMAVSLVNTSSSFVVSGPERSLLALIDTLKSVSAKDAQSRVRYSQRKPNPTFRFLPVTIPCHCPLLADAVPVIENDLQDLHIAPQSLRIPVNRTGGGSDLNSIESSDLVPTLIRLITSEQVRWPDVDLPNATHIIDFGPGGTSGAGALTHRINAGRGIRVIISSKLGLPETSDFGSVTELFDHNEESIRRAPRWSDDYAASLVRTGAGTMVDTKLSRLLRLPLFVAGMTPTTTHPEFVAAVMNAGYHIEFAAGGYHNADSLRKALVRLRDLMPQGRGITVNVIYVNPKAIAWQIPFIAELRSEGFPITGLTIGGGVPSVEVATEYIMTLGLDHISFKPGSVDAIGSVLETARRNPTFPVILQWTGGRGGGHHSYEDFHAPILETYSEIRKCSNVVLVAGSGFGSAEDVHPYLTGDWSLSRGSTALMPFDGILFGSRVMTCAEARTSPGAKAAIACAPGVKSEDEWEKTYAGPAGGIISVISEMGEPIHVVATRGTLFWAELDKMVFSLDKSKRAAVLAANKVSIINKLNADFQKPWFGRHDETPAELSDMTYLEVLVRMVEIMFVKSRNSWIDDSYAKFFYNFVMRTLERLAADDDLTAIGAISESTCALLPTEIIDAIRGSTLEGLNTQLCTEDVHYFIQLCRQPGQKPVPFIPVLDDNFETYFKKDSLWQSEDTDSVPGQDPLRTFILHGPVAARATCVVDEPVKAVLDSINDGASQHILQYRYGGVSYAVPYEEFVRPAQTSQDGGCFEDSLTALSSGSAEDFRAFLRGRGSSWRSALFGTANIARGSSIIANPVRKLIDALTADAVSVDIDDVPGAAQSRITLYQHQKSSETIALQIFRTGREIQVIPFSRVTASNRPIPLVMRFEYRPDTPYALVREVVENRDERIYAMYRQLWLGRMVADSKPGNESPEVNVFEDVVIIDRSQVREFNRAVGYHKAHSMEKVPMDFAMVASWKTISQALLQDPVQGDLLALVHLSNSYEVAKSAEPLRLDAEVRTKAYVSEIVIDDSGKTVEVTCELQEEPSAAMILTIKSRFLFRGTYQDFSPTFTRSVGKFETKMGAESDVAVLTSRPWFIPSPSFASLNGATLEFHISTLARYQSKTVYNLIETTGTVYRRSESDELTIVGGVCYREACCTSNAVISYLARVGTPLGDQQQPLKGDAPAPSHAADITVPSSNEAYSRASGDFNPIHTSPMFAALVNLPGTITHGMYCSAVVRGVLEKHEANQQPSRIRKYAVSFVGMVLPEDVLDISFTHVAMQDGMKVIKIDVSNASTGAKVLAGEALVAQPRTTVLFTGQGSQEKGMGMDLYEASAVARQIWQRADDYFRSQFGLSILDIVRHNPRQIKVHFGGVRGRILRKNYQGMFYESADANGTLERKPVFPTVGDDTTSFTHSSPNGLLFTTQFAQPALTIMELAAFRDMQAHGVVDPDCMFAGHSLGEYAALAAITDFMPFERLLYVVFCRGMTMQLAVERNSKGQSDFGMLAVDPGRVGKGFDDSNLRQLVAAINSDLGFFIEIVNLNIRNSQYVCAGDLRALDLLQRVLDAVKSGAAPDARAAAALAAQHAVAYRDRAASSIKLTRGAATIPLAGMDVPFHSSFLRPHMEAFRRVLLANIEQARIRPTMLVGRYIPNVTARPFDIGREYVEDVLRITSSERIADVLENWGEWMERVDTERRAMLTAADGIDEAAAAAAA